MLPLRDRGHEKKRSWQEADLTCIFAHRCPCSPASLTTPGIAVIAVVLALIVLLVVIIVRQRKSMQQRKVSFGSSQSLASASSGALSALRAKGGAVGQRARAWDVPLLLMSFFPLFAQTRA